MKLEINPAVWRSREIKKNTDILQWMILYIEIFSQHKIFKFLDVHKFVWIIKWNENNEHSISVGCILFLIRVI